MPKQTPDESYPPKKRSSEVENINKNICESKKAYSIVICAEIFLLCALSFFTFFIDSSTDLYYYFVRPLVINMMMIVVGISCIIKFIKFKSCMASKIAGFGFIIVYAINILFLFIGNFYAYESIVQPVILGLTGLISLYAIYKLINKK